MTSFLITITVCVAEATVLCVLTMTDDAESRVEESCGVEDSSFVSPETMNRKGLTIFIITKNVTKREYFSSLAHLSQE